MSPKRLTYAGRVERLFASVIDRTLLLMPGAVLANIWGAESGIAMFLYFFVNLAYYTGFTAGAWQATPGQRLLSMYVIHADGAPLTQRDALERFLAFVLPSLPLYSSMVSENLAPMITVWLSIFWFSPILYTPERVGVHDRICNTRVVTGRAGEGR